MSLHFNRLLAEDLKAAGIAGTDDAGRVVDVYSLRMTFATLMAKGGVPQRIAQELMRHSAPRLTANVYTKLQLHDTRGALDALPALSVNREVKENAAVVGGDSLAPPLAATQYTHRGNSGHLLSSWVLRLTINALRKEAAEVLVPSTKMAC